MVCQQHFCICLCVWFSRQQFLPLQSGSTALCLCHGVGRLKKWCVEAIVAYECVRISARIFCKVRTWNCAAAKAEFKKCCHEPSSQKACGVAARTRCFRSSICFLQSGRERFVTRLGVGPLWYVLFGVCGSSVRTSEMFWTCFWLAAFSHHNASQWPEQHRQVLNGQRSKFSHYRNGSNHVHVVLLFNRTPSCDPLNLQSSFIHVEAQTVM